MSKLHPNLLYRRMMPYTDEGMALTGTCVMEKVRLAVDQRYKILTSYVVYENQVIR